MATPPDEQTIADVGRAAHAFAYIVIANRRYTDLFEWGQRSVPLSLAAEIQHRLLPGSYTCEAGQFTLAAWLEPAGDVGGDTFDFSLDRDALSFSMTDAMGHSVNAALLATLMIGSVRNGRRRGADLAEQAQLADEALAEHAGRSQYVTGQIVRVDLLTGTAEIVNAGHPLPLRLRDGVVDEVPLEADPPFGALPGQTFRRQTLPLRARRPAHVPHRRRARAPGGGRRRPRRPRAEPRRAPARGGAAPHPGRRPRQRRRAGGRRDRDVLRLARRARRATATPTGAPTSAPEGH